MPTHTMTSRRLVTLRRFIACSIAAALVVAGRPSAATSNFLWKATSRSGSGTIYLVGSLHLLTSDFYPLNAAFETAFNDSDLLVEELDLGEMSAPGSQFQFLM